MFVANGDARNCPKASMLMLVLMVLTVVVLTIDSGCTSGWHSSGVRPEAVRSSPANRKRQLNHRVMTSVGFTIGLPRSPPVQLLYTQLVSVITVHFVPT